MPYFTGLARVARTTGFPVVEIPGWEKRGHGSFASCQSIICHHTAGSAKGNYPSLDVVAYGRTGLAGPLSQFGLGRDGTIYVIAAGWAAHAGKDSLVRPAHARNLYSIGIEAENTGLGEPWPAVQMESYVRLVRALIDEFGLDVSRVYGHKEVAYTESGRLGRKPDPAGINMDTFRAAVKRGTWSATIKPAAPDNTSRPSITTPAPEPLPEPEPTTPHFQEEDMLFIWGRTRGRILSGGVFAGVPFSLIEMARAAKVPVVSLTDEAHTSLSNAFADRTQKVALDEEKDG